MAEYSSLSRSNPGEVFSSATQQMQQDLLSLGFKLPKFGADGKFGVETEQAVKDFQYTYLGSGFVTGVVDQGTATAIKSAVSRLTAGEEYAYVQPKSYPIAVAKPTTTTFPVQKVGLNLGFLQGLDMKWIGLGIAAAIALTMFMRRR